jgi:pyruvate dehydrogenase E2 component (dihydrolipoamide acetyltransferase)
LIRELDPAFDVVAPDLPGFGRSRDLSRTSMDAFASAVHDLILADQRDRVHLAGISMGAIVALRVALAAPGKVATLSLIAPALPGWPTLSGLSLLAETAPGLRVVARYLRGKLSLDTAAALTLRLCYANGSAVDPSVIRRIHGDLRRLRTRRGHAAFVSAGRSLVVEHMRVRNRVTRSALNLRMPVQILVGSEDRLVPMASVRRFVRSCPSCRIACIEGAGHAIATEASADVARHLEALMSLAKT